MKVGVDGVLVGAWAPAAGSRVLDVGTGCGLIALMMAQRNPCANVLAIDIDDASINEAGINILNSPWKERITVRKESFQELVEEVEKGNKEKFDLIVSNPPYYASGVIPSDSRTRARHQGELSPRVLVNTASGILTGNGRLAMIVPTQIYSELCTDLEKTNLILTRLCEVRNHPTAKSKRVLLEFRVGKREDLNPENINKEELIMFDKSGAPSEPYRILCGDFYLKF